MNAPSSDRGVWVPCSERMPPARLDVFAYYLNQLGKGRTVRAEYVPARTVRADEWGWADDCSDMFDVDENDEEWVAAGWWERALTPDVSYALNETITHWMLIPEPPK